MKKKIEKPTEAEKIKIYALIGEMMVRAKFAEYIVNAEDVDQPTLTLYTERLSKCQGLADQMADEYVKRMLLAHKASRDVLGEA